ncbi:MAG: S1C family serine protease [Myxococcota bacterium]
MHASELSESFARVVESAAGTTLTLSGGGTAAVWEGGVAIAAAHSLERAGEPRLRLPDGDTVPATVAGVDPATDLAALRFTGPAVRPAWSDADGLKVGHLVFAVSPARATVSIVQSLGGPWRTPAGGRVDRYVETGLGPWPGFSGSLLLDAGGRAIGLNTSGLSRRSSLAIPTATLRRVVGDLLAHGRSRRAFVGVATWPVRLDPKAAARAGQENGLLVTSVQPEGPADAAGIVLGDALLAVDGRPLARPEDLLGHLDGDRAGATATFRVLRAGEPLDVTITLGTRS